MLNFLPTVSLSEKNIKYYLIWWFHDNTDLMETYKMRLVVRVPFQPSRKAICNFLVNFSHTLAWIHLQHTRIAVICARWNFFLSLKTMENSDRQMRPYGHIETI